MEYKTLEGIPGQYFDCPCGLGLLSVVSCGKAYKAAMSPEGLKEGRRITCRACTVGALHAGVPVNEASASRFLGTLKCSRCHNDARRLIRGSICVSCYNREREVLIGKNAKGGRPIFGKSIFATLVASVFDDGKTSKVQSMDKVTSKDEAILSLLRAESKSVSFMWVGSSLEKGK